MLLEIKNLWVNYGGSDILKGISFEVEEGSIVTYLGNNGAGKSTTLRAICGLKHPASGEIWFNGKRIDGKLPEDIIKLGLGHVLEGRALFPYMSVMENLILGAYLQKNRKEINGSLEEVYTHFPRLKERLRQQARTLSGGEQQMLAIARALMGKPKLLLLDEPSLGLSPLMIQEIGKIIQEIQKRGTSVLLVEQNVRLALGIAQTGYVLETGEIVLSGDAKILLNDPQVKRAYLGI
jgi:branched-chain amino acid transport system ATP-binding protein